EIRVATVATGSQSAGGKRWRSRTARSLVVRGRPPARAAGRTGATQVHAALVRSVSESRVHRTVLWPGSALFQDRRQLSNTLSDRDPQGAIRFDLPQCGGLH